MDGRYDPLKVMPERVRRTYRGGKCLDLWHGNRNGTDGDMPEEWLASMTEAVNPGFTRVEKEGLSKVCIRGNNRLLRELIEEAPEDMLGKEHYKSYGARMGVLAKLLDPAERLSIQVHPDKQFAKEYFHSEYGKTECWHVVSVRETEWGAPYLLMGFRRGMTREIWERLYREQDIEGMVAGMNRLIPKPGETYLVPGGLPHAIGPGCHMIEIQEPTDYTMRTERTTADGKQIPDELIHQGLGEELLLDCFHYENMDEEEVRNHYRIPPKETVYENGSVYSLLVGPGTTECFSMDRTEVHGALTFENGNHFTVLVVLSGSGTLFQGDGREPVASGDQFFIPARAGKFSVEGGAEGCTIVRCFPPGAEPVPPENMVTAQTGF